MNRRLLENAFYTYVLQGANYILPLVTIPYLLRVLNADGFGLLSFAQAMAQYFVILTEYGFNLTATRDVALCRDDRTKLREIFWTTIFTKAVLAAAGFAAMAALVLSVAKFRPDWQVYAAAFLTVAGNVMIPAWFFQGMEKMRAIMVIIVLARTAATALVFALVKGPADIALAAGLNSLGAAAAGAAGLYAARRIFSLEVVVPSPQAMLRTLKEGWRIFLSTVAVNIYTTTNVFVLGLFTDNTVTGIYSAADKIIRAVQGLLTPVAQSLYPHITALAARSPDLAFAFIRKVLALFGFCSFALSLAIFLAADAIVGLFAGTGYRQSAELVRIMAFIPFFVALSNVFGIQTMLPFKMTALFSRIIVAASALDLLILFPLLLFFGAAGAAGAAAAAELAVTVAMGVVLWRRGFPVFWPRKPRRTAAMAGVRPARHKE